MLNLFILLLVLLECATAATDNTTCTTPPSYLAVRSLLQDELQNLTPQSSLQMKLDNPLSTDGSLLSASLDPVISEGIKLIMCLA